ncbi:MAG TPA: polymer-forming cytoskeletal protein [Candidatus Binataceae bacterium]|nr:polymer-forming cytoskeletal protein [Candidatus Binataceae bacterium]
MALFNREPDKNVKPDAAKGPVSVPSKPAPIPTVSAVPVQPERSAAPVAQSVAPVRPAAPTGDSAAYLDRTSKITGKLMFEASTRLDGTIEGEITAKDHLVIGESAVITAQIKAASIVVAGKVNGDITATQRIEIRPAGRVVGNLTAPVFVVHEGALFEGHCSMQADAAQNERKVTVFPKEERIANGTAAANPAPEVSAQKSA